MGVFSCVSRQAVDDRDAAPLRKGLHDAKDRKPSLNNSTGAPSWTNQKSSGNGHESRKGAVSVTPDSGGSMREMGWKDWVKKAFARDSRDAVMEKGWKDKVKKAFGVSTRPPMPRHSATCSPDNNEGRIHASVTKSVTAGPLLGIPNTTHEAPREAMLCTITERQRSAPLPVWLTPPEPQMFVADKSEDEVDWSSAPRWEPLLSDAVKGVTCLDFLRDLNKAPIDENQILTVDVHLNSLVQNFAQTTIGVPKEGLDPAPKGPLFTITQLKDRRRSPNESNESSSTHAAAHAEAGHAGHPEAHGIIMSMLLHGADFPRAESAPGPNSSHSASLASSLACGHRIVENILDACSVTPPITVITHQKKSFGSRRAEPRGYVLDLLRQKNGTMPDPKAFETAASRAYEARFVPSAMSRAFSKELAADLAVTHTMVFDRPPTATHVQTNSMTVKASHSER